MKLYDIILFPAVAQRRRPRKIGLFVQRDPLHLQIRTEAELVKACIIEAAPVGCPLKPEVKLHLVVSELIKAEFKVLTIACNRRDKVIGHIISPDSIA